MRHTISAALLRERGFTLVEVLLVLIVIGILSLISVASYLNYRERAHDAAAQENLHRVIPSVHAYFVDNESYVGMMFDGLRLTYDSTIDPSQFSFGSVAPTQSTYCVQSSFSGRTWRKNGPNAPLESQPCP